MPVLPTEPPTGSGVLAPGTVQGYVPDVLLPQGDRLTLSPVFGDAYIKGASVRSAAWYFDRLMHGLDARAPRLLEWDRYYRGDQPLAFASAKFREAFGGRFKAFSSNFCALVVDGTRERMEVTGFRFASARSTKAAWRIWQDNDMDGQSQIAHTEALIKGLSYALVEPPSPVSGGSPRITIEDALDAITDCDPRDRRTRRAGLKRYVDDDGHLTVYLYLPDLIYRLRSSAKWNRDAPYSGTWEPAPLEGEEWPMRNRLGLVPLVPLPNRPRLRVEGVSEIDPVMSNQDAINKYRADALVAAEFAAFRQRWATGLDIPDDPVTGQPVEPFKSAVDRLWVVPPPDPEDPNPPTVAFGEFEATDLQPYQTMIESEVGAMSSISRLPYHYLLGQPAAVPPSGESLKSSESGLVSKVRTSLIHLGEGWEETMRLCLAAVGDRSADRSAETEWRDPETRNEGVRADSTVKVFQAGIIDRPEARSALGYPPGGAPAPAGDGAPPAPSVIMDGGTPVVPAGSANAAPA
jgi:hypothetical protein